MVMIQRRAAIAALLMLTIVGAGCGGFRRDYEYEEEVYLALDGTATVVVSASVASLVSLRGATLPVDPRARLDREAVRRFFAGPGVQVVSISTTRRHGRRFVHVTLDVSDIRRLTELSAFDWSRYQFRRAGDVMEFQQLVGTPAAGRAIEAGLRGDERVAFRFHVPSEIPFHTSPKPLQRGNILEWDQGLTERLQGVPIDIRIQMEPESILYTTLLLFLSTIVAAAATFAGVIWWVVRKGRRVEAV